MKSSSCSAYLVSRLVRRRLGSRKRLENARGKGCNFSRRTDESSKPIPAGGWPSGRERCRASPRQPPRCLVAVNQRRPTRIRWVAMRDACYGPPAARGRWWLRLAHPERGADVRLCLALQRDCRRSRARANRPSLLVYACYRESLWRGTGVVTGRRQHASGAVLHSPNCAASLERRNGCKKLKEQASAFISNHPDFIQTEAYE